MVYCPINAVSMNLVQSTINNSGFNKWTTINSDNYSGYKVIKPRQWDKISRKTVGRQRVGRGKSRQDLVDNSGHLDATEGDCPRLYRVNMLIQTSSHDFVTTPRTTLGLLTLFSVLFWHIYNVTLQW